MSEIVVAAIDFGTTYSGWAFLYSQVFERNPLKFCLRNWMSVQLISNKAPSCVLIRPDGTTLDSFGYDAENKYVKLAEDGNHYQWYFFRRFQLMLLKRIEIGHNLCVEDSSGKKLPAKKVFALLIRYFKDDIIQKLGDSIPHSRIANSYIHWVLAAPAILNDAAKQFMREVAQDAEIPRKNMTIVSEPQAASVFCTFLPPDKFVGRHRTSLSMLKIGTKYIVLDAGGMSVKFTVHEILGANKVRELFSSSIDCGSTNVNEAFENFLGEIVVSMQRLMKSLDETRTGLPCYKMDRKPRGWCIIINVEKFDNSHTRKGSQHDRHRLQNVFGNLHFIVVCYDNLTSKEIMKQLVNASTNTDHSEFDCFVCCILSHGSLGHVYGSDMKVVPIKEITSTFNAYRCPTLAGKPKLFFMQACQGKDIMPGATSLETDSLREETIPLEADFLYGYATVPGHVAYRETEHGSWYMRALCDTLEEHHNSCHLLEILTEVNRKVARESAKDGLTTIAR